MSLNKLPTLRRYVYSLAQFQGRPNKLPLRLATDGVLRLSGREDLIQLK